MHGRLNQVHADEQRFADMRRKFPWRAHRGRESEGLLEITPPDRRERARVEGCALHGFISSLVTPAGEIVAESSVQVVVPTYGRQESQYVAEFAGMEPVLLPDPFCGSVTCQPLGFVPLTGQEAVED
jgi:hypothetical protein